MTRAIIFLTVFSLLFVLPCRGQSAEGTSAEGMADDYINLKKITLLSELKSLEDRAAHSRNLWQRRRLPPRSRMRLGSLMWNWRRSCFVRLMNLPFRRRRSRNGFVTYLPVPYPVRPPQIVEQGTKYESECLASPGGIRISPTN